MVPPKLFNRFATAGRLGDQTHVGLIGDERGDSITNQSVDVSCENANYIRTGAHLRIIRSLNVLSPEAESATRF